MCVYKGGRKKSVDEEEKSEKESGGMYKKFFLRGKERKGVGESVCVCVSV